MGTDDASSALPPILSGLARPEWNEVLKAVSHAERWLLDAGPGAPDSDAVVQALAGLSRHPKWEVRRAIAQTAGQLQHTAFESTIMRLAVDDNSRVRQAAELAAGRRRDWKNASLLGKQHEDRINATLDDIEVRFGRRGRDAVRRASEEIANTYARELYHETIKLLTPLAMSVERLGQRIANESVSRAELQTDAATIQKRVGRLRTVQEAMRGYTAVPKLQFTDESLKAIAEEAASLVRDANERRGVHVSIDVTVPETLTAQVDRGRLIQAFTNLLHNAIEAYEGLPDRAPVVVVKGFEEGARSTLMFIDAGCGMSEESLRDAPMLFATNKPDGTGFGLPLAIKIVESEHSGQLVITSERGVGTRVEVRLPTQRR